MTVGFIIKLFVEILVFAVIVMGLLKEEKLIAFEDEILRIIAKAVRKHKRAKAQACRNIPIEPQHPRRVAVKAPDHAA